MIKKSIFATAISGILLTSVLAQQATMNTYHSMVNNDLCLGIDYDSQSYEGAKLKLQKCSKRQEGQLFNGGLQNWFSATSGTFSGKFQYMPNPLPAGPGFCLKRGKIGEQAMLTACDKADVASISHQAGTLGYFVQDVGFTVLESESQTDGAKVFWRKERVPTSNTQSWNKEDIPR